MPGLGTSDPTRRHAIGAFHAGRCEPVDGRIASVVSARGPFASAQVLFSVKAVNFEDIRGIGTLDGLPIFSGGVHATDNPISIPTLPDGEHDLAIRTQRASFSPRNGATDDPDGRRVLITWANVADAFGYVIYSDNGDPEATLAPIATVETIEADGLFQEPPTSGTGTGTITLGGLYNGPAVNAAWRIKFGADSTFQVDPGTGSYGTAKHAAPGVATNIGYGLTVRFDSPRSLYAVNDEWTFRVAAARKWISGELTTASYSFKIAAKDRDGNIFTEGNLLSVAVDPAPRGPSASSVSFDEDTDTFAFLFTSPAEATKVRLYTNYSTDYLDLEGAVILEAPVAEWDADEGDGGEGHAATWTPDSVPDGEWQFILRAVDANGRESRNVDVLRISTPTSAVGIGEPFDPQVANLPGLHVNFSWGYDTRDGEVTDFDIYLDEAGTANPDPFDTPFATVAADETAPIFRQTLELDLSGEALPTHLLVRARKDSTKQSRNLDWVEASPEIGDLAAPTGEEILIV